MNNSFPKLVEGMIAALRENVLPATAGEFARGQAFGVIYMLESLRLRAGWSPEFLREQLAAQSELHAALSRIDGLPATAPRPAIHDATSSPVSATSADLMAARDAGDTRICELIDWLAQQGTSLPPRVAGAADEAVTAYLNRQLRHELTTSAKPMFAEISLGRETPK